VRILFLGHAPARLDNHPRPGENRARRNGRYCRASLTARQRG
jgi:hypothetical protein